MEHCIKQEDYLLWKAYLIDNIFIDKKLNRRCSISLHTKYVKGKEYKSIRATLQWKDYIFEHLFNKVYPIHKNRKKEIQYLLNEVDKDIHLAIWFMDDGGERTKLLKNGSWCSPHYRLFVYNFTEGQVNYAKQWFSQRYSITPKVLLHQKSKPYFAFSVKDSKKIFKLCKPYFENMESMKNKFKASFARFDYKIESAPEMGEKIVHNQ